MVDRFFSGKESQIYQFANLLMNPICIYYKIKNIENNFQDLKPLI